MSNTTETGIEGTEADHGSFEGAVAYQMLETQDKPTEPELSAANVEAIALKFRPVTEVDQNGLTRHIYQSDGVSFSFSGREETPIYPTIEASRPVRLGHESWWLNHPPNQDAPKLAEDEILYYKDSGFSDETIAQIDGERFEEWDTEYQRLASYEPTLNHLRDVNIDRPEHFITEQSPYGIYLLLSKLQPENPRWEAAAKSVAQNQYDEEALRLIDMVTAINDYYIKQEHGSASRPAYGEVIAIAALMGDNQAQLITDQAVQIQRDQDIAFIEQARVAVASRETAAEIEAFKPGDLVVVHATAYEPSETPDGFQVVTTHDASGFPRSTVHTSLNHKVDNAGMYGEWDSKDYVVIAGLDKVMQANGDPRSLNGADTWWTRDPGEPLRLPGATLIMPGGDQDKLVIEAGHRQMYKSIGFTDADIEQSDTILPGTSTRIRKALDVEDGQPIPIDSSDAQKIIANIIRDVLVWKEISVTRGLKVEAQEDDKFMPGEFNQRVYKMAKELKIPLTGALHAESEESYVERDVSRGEIIYNVVDPKIRRVAYASGFMTGGGTARKEFSSRKQDKLIPGD